MTGKLQARVQRALEEHFEAVYKMRSADDKKPYSEAVRKHFKPDLISDFGIQRTVVIRLGKRSFKINYAQWYRGVPQFNHNPEHMDDDGWYYPKRNVTVARVTLVNHGDISDEELKEAWSVRHAAVAKFLDLYQTRTN